MDCISLLQVPKMSKEVAEEYLSSLADLTVNSKPLINMLTMLADENVDHAPAIVQVIENHLEKVIKFALSCYNYGICRIKLIWKIKKGGLLFY